MWYSEGKTIRNHETNEIFTAISSKEAEGISEKLNSLDTSNGRLRACERIIKSLWPTSYESRIQSYIDDSSRT